MQPNIFHLITPYFWAAADLHDSGEIMGLFAYIIKKSHESFNEWRFPSTNLEFLCR